jgi:protein-disulfide isomerase
MVQLRTPVTSLDHSFGSEDASVTIVEYGDYECPHCAAAQGVVARVLAQFGESVRLVYRHFPLVEVHPLSITAAEAAEFAGSKGAFWPMHQSIFANQQRLSASLLVALAAQLKLSPVALRDAIASRTFAQKVQTDFLGGVRSGVNGTPTFFVNGTRHDSPYGFEDLPSAIDQAISSAAA